MSIKCNKKRNYITLPNGKEIELFTIDSNGVPIFAPEFIRLWSLLNDVGKASPPTFVGKITDFSLPRESKSSLVGTPYLTDPSSIVRVYSFKNLTLNGGISNGPISNEGFALDISNEDLYYKISWNIRNNNNKNNVKIGFYRSNGFTYNTTNNLALICGDKGPALFTRSEGSFTFEGISQLYVATDAEVTVDLEVSVVIPKKRISPLVTKCDPYIGYITVCDGSTKWELPVYKIKSIRQGYFRMEDKRATSMFKDAVKVIHNYLRRTALSLLLFDDEPGEEVPSRLEQRIGSRLMQSQIKTYTNVGTRVYAPSIADYVTVGMNTNDIGPDKIDEFARVHQGIKLERPENVSNDTVPRISFRILTGKTPNNLGKVFVGIIVSYYINWRWPTHYRLDNQGNVVGDAIYPEDSEAMFINIGDGLEHSFILKNDATDFSITVYYNEVITSEAAQHLSDNTKFESITVEWITLPTT